VCFAFAVRLIYEDTPMEVNSTSVKGSCVCDGRLRLRSSIETRGISRQSVRVVSSPDVASYVRSSWLRTTVGSSLCEPSDGSSLLDILSARLPVQTYYSIHRRTKFRI
jgi:hypothetical protein